MGYLKIWIHLVWSTKYRKPLLTEEIRRDLFSHMRENAAKKGIYVDFINGWVEHVHCLISLHSGQNIDKIVMLLKGESSWWVNKNRLCRRKFEWQTDYFAVSVSESGVNRVRNYIRNQENHHRKKEFEEEYRRFMDLYKFDALNPGLKPGETHEDKDKPPGSPGCFPGLKPGKTHEKREGG